MHGLLLRERGRVQEAYEACRTALEALDGTDEKTVPAELRELLAAERLPTPTPPTPAQSTRYTVDHFASA